MAVTTLLNNVICQVSTGLLTNHLQPLESKPHLTHNQQYIKGRAHPHVYN